MTNPTKMSATSNCIWLADHFSPTFPEEQNLKTYMQVCDRQRISPYAFQFSVQDVHHDGTCPCVRHSVRPHNQIYSPLVEEKDILFNCSENVRSRLITVCANQTYHKSLPIHAYQIALLTSELPITAKEFWTIVEQSPAWPSWLKETRDKMTFFPCGYSFDEPGDRLHDLGDMHFLDLGRVRLGLGSPHTCMLPPRPLCCYSQLIF